MNNLLEPIFQFLEMLLNIITIGVHNMDDLYSYDTDCSDDSSDQNETSINEINNKRLKQYNNVHTEARRLFEQKNQDYGDSFAYYGTAGVLMRMADKLNRYQSITRNGVTIVDDEQLRDTLIDLHNYSAMAVMLLDE
jgi:hypothetical protein